MDADLLEGLNEIFGRCLETEPRLHHRRPAETDMQQYFRVSPPSVHQDGVDT
jgi:hypothetical protein